MLQYIYKVIFKQIQFVSACNLVDFNCNSMISCNARNFLFSLKTFPTNCEFSTLQAKYNCQCNIHGFQIWNKWYARLF